MMFTDSIDENVETIRELLGGIRPEDRKRAKKAAVMVENMVVRLQKEYPKDAAVALGAAFAIYMIAQRFVQNQKEQPERGLIQLLQ